MGNEKTCHVCLSPMPVMTEPVNGTCSKECARTVALTNEIRDVEDAVLKLTEFLKAQAS